MNRRQRREAGITTHSSVGAKELDWIRQQKVDFAFIHPGEVDTAFMRSTLKMYRYMRQNLGVEPGTNDEPGAAAHLWTARNRIMQAFLDGPSDWLLFIDADMGFPEWTLHRMLMSAKHAPEDNLPVVGGLCFALIKTDWNPENDAEIFEIFPTIMLWNRNDEGEILGYKYVTEYPEDECLKVDSSGAACVLIPRWAVEKIGHDWFTPIKIPPEVDTKGFVFFGEDISFFIRCAEVGVPVWLDTTVRTSHHKGGVWLTHEMYQQQQALKAAMARLEAADDAPA